MLLVYRTQLHRKANRCAPHRALPATCCPSNSTTTATAITAAALRFQQQPQCLLSAAAVSLVLSLMSPLSCITSTARFSRCCFSCSGISGCTAAATTAILLGTWLLRQVICSSRLLLLLTVTTSASSISKNNFAVVTAVSLEVTLANRLELSMLA
jgi:hypothetical protein